VIVGRAYLFCASHDIIFWTIFHPFKNPINHDDYSNKLMPHFLGM
jgi:hypothetical protein